ncbi:MAG: hypothetical protein AAF515_18115 [Pseudomonadota bacterium]
MNAYTDLTVKLVKKAAKLDAPEKALQAAQASLAGTVGGAEVRAGTLIGGLDLKKVREDKVAEITKIQDVADAKTGRLAEATENDLGEFADEIAQKYPNGLQTGELDAFKAEKTASIRKQAISEMTAIAESYGELIEALQHVAAQPAKEAEGS